MQIFLRTLALFFPKASISDVTRSIGNGKITVELFSEAIPSGSGVAKLHGHRVDLDDLGGLGKFLGRLELSLGVNYLRPAFALGFGLPRHRPRHLNREIDVFHLHVGDLDSPGLGLYDR